MVAALGLGGVAIAHAVGGGSTGHGGAGFVAAKAPARPVVPSFPVVPTPPSPPVHVHHHASHATHRRPAPELRIIDVHGPCYVQVSHAGRVIERTIMRQGQTKAFRRHGLDVVLGNAGAVRLRIDGHRAVPGGRSGQVRTLRVA